MNVGSVAFRFLVGALVLALLPLVIAVLVGAFAVEMWHERPRSS